MKLESLTDNYVAIRQRVWLINNAASFYDRIQIFKSKDTNMPLTLTITEGVLPAGSEKQAFARLSEAMLKWHGLTGNKVLTPNITGTIHVLPKEQTFSGMEEVSGAWIEWKVPSFAFNTLEVQQGFFADATQLHEMSGGKLPVERIWINVVHTVDGAWNLDGQAMTNEQLVQSISGEAISAG